MHRNIICLFLLSLSVLLTSCGSAQDETDPSGFSSVRHCFDTVDGAAPLDSSDNVDYYGELDPSVLGNPDNQIYP
ncbi:MAG: hypothetical protein HYS21_05980 [Deltaproteobacteria bacterium]|nr:hypothetical protein [Deltaproteobacteria bacterium]